ncbi:SIR2 family NAD-dependent protein deacylase [Lysobacter claricitrinus]|uniref:SIR2 family NAD-dependent protein deacylase n=1 Tax=Lysobacter claricitrinus TaxID=3367728 RepID=UPI0037DB5D82
MKVAFLTGAGMSAESGVPTFRDALTGLWARFDPERLATPEAFRSDPDLVWGWYRWRAAQVQRVQPHAGHSAIAALESDGFDIAVVTQNVDDLHERAGSSRVHHLHGHLLRSRCIDCGAMSEPDPIVAPYEGDADGHREAPPRCAACGGRQRPGVVWFGEALPDEAWSAGVDAIRGADRVVVVGTSGLVQPAASLPGLARRLGIHVLEINPQPSALTADVDEYWPMTASAGLLRLAGELRGT